VTQGLIAKVPHGGCHMELEQTHRGSLARRSFLGLAICEVSLAVAFLFGPSVVVAETRGYVIGWFATATNSDVADNCPRAARDPKRSEYIATGGVPPRNDRALVDGKPVPPLDYPDAVQVDPNIETVVGKYAYGFDLGGPAANKFIDPETHEKVDNQLWRAIGCATGFEATPPVLPYSETAPWENMVDTEPAYAIQVTGADLSKDGPVTVTLDRTLRHLERDAAGGVRSDVTYVLDPSPRSHNVLSGQIMDGRLTIKPGNIWLEGDMPFYSQIDLKNAHMRMRSVPGGKIVGYWGGYTDWHVWISTYTARPAASADGVGIYRAMEKLADAGPDPVTGKNQLISTTWRVEAVPAFLATTDGKILAVASAGALGGKLQQSDSHRR
jgi:hypothetical protein